MTQNPQLNPRQRNQIISPVVYDSSGYTCGDIGHALVKGTTDFSRTSFIHALIEIDPADWDNLKLRGMLTNEYYRVNGKYYAVGSAAELESPGITAREGAGRYTPDYYGILGAILLHRLHDEGHEDITWYAGHAPEYINYRKEIRSAIKGNWTVEDNKGVIKKFTVNTVLFFDEPQGGAMNLILTTDGAGFQNKDMMKGKTLAIDIGGFTVNTALLLNGKVIDLHSDTGVGINSALKQLHDSLRSKHHDKLQDVSTIDPAYLREALATGYYNAGGYGMLDVTKQAERANAAVLSAVTRRYKYYGGVAGAGFISLSGGGAGAYDKLLREILKHPNIFLSARLMEIHLANAFGGLKMLHFYKRQGAF